jgi:hypothetical protein
MTPLSGLSKKLASHLHPVQFSNDWNSASGAPVHLNGTLLREITLFYFANECVCSAEIIDTVEPEYYENLKNI